MIRLKCTTKIALCELHFHCKIIPRVRCIPFCFALVFHITPGDGVPAVPALCAQRPRSQKHPCGQWHAGENCRLWADQDYSFRQGVLPSHSAWREPHFLVPYLMSETSEMCNFLQFVDAAAKKCCGGLCGSLLFDWLKTWLAVSSCFQSLD